MYENEIPVGRAKDLRGQKFGAWTVLCRVKNRNGKIVWLCECECGTQRGVYGDNLKSGKTHSCGCKKQELRLDTNEKNREKGIFRNNFKDITGQRFGTLIAKRPLSERGPNRQIIWECQCDCGKIINVRGTSLRYGEVSSCGSAACRGLEKDMTGMVFGKLTVISKSDYKNSYSNHTYWNCKCECGNTCIVMGHNLRNGTTKSCGCLLSTGEMIISQLLNKQNFSFEQQKTFEGCYLNNGGKCRFDFYVDNTYLIEFDGMQHFKPVEHFGGEEQFKIQQQRDNYKNQWCKENNIPLIRIPYTKLETLCIEDLMLDTTQFRVV